MSRFYDNDTSISYDNVGFPLEVGAVQLEFWGNIPATQEQCFQNYQYPEEPRKSQTNIEIAVTIYYLGT
jgi:hypothetical protein